MRNLCAVVVDMQPGFTENVETDELCTLINAQRRTLEFFRDNGLPVMVFEFSPERFGKTIDEIQTIVDACSNVVKVEKAHNDGFLYTNADESLDRFEATDLTFMGVNASYCVPATAVGAIKGGKRRMNTARQLIADEVDVSQRVNLSQWYGSRGIYKEDYRSLLTYLEALHSDTIYSMPSRVLQQV